MASRAFLAVAAALAVILAGLLLLWPSDPAPLPERIVPGLILDEVTRVSIARPDQPTIVLERKDGGFVLAEPVSAQADPQAVRDVLGTLEMLAARRQESGSVDDPALIVTVKHAGRPVTLRMASDTGATDRVWLTASHRPGRALIDGYAYRALDVSVAELMDWRPLRGVTDQPRRIEVTFGEQATVVRGPPWLVELPGGAALADTAVIGDLLANLDNLTVEPYPDDPVVDPIGRVEVTGATGVKYLDVYPTRCGADGSVVAWTARRGCLEDSSWLADLVTSSDDLLDRQLFRGSRDDVIGVTIERDSGTIEMDRGDDPGVVRRWLDRLALASEQAVVTGAAGASPIGTITIASRAGPVQTIDILGQDGAILLRRSGEPVAWRLPDAAAQLVSIDSHLYRSLDLLEFEPSRLQSVTARQAGQVIESIEVGETLETWRAVRPAGASVDTDAANRLRDQLSHLRAVRVVASAAGPRHGFGPSAHSIEIVLFPIDPDDSDQVEQLVIGDGSPAGGCFARLAADPVVFELSADACQTLTDPWTDEGT